MLVTQRYMCQIPATHIVAPECSPLMATFVLGVIANGIKSIDDALQVAVIDPEVRHGILVLRPENVLLLGGKVRLLKNALQDVSHCCAFSILCMLLGPSMNLIWRHCGSNDLQLPELRQQTSNSAACKTSQILPSLC